MRDDDGGFDSGSFEDKIEADKKNRHSFFGVEIFATTSEWNSLFLAVTKLDDWVEHNSLAEAIANISVCSTPGTSDSFKDCASHLLGLTRRSNELYRRVIQTIMKILPDHVRE